MVGDGIYIVAIAWQVYQLSNTPTALAIVGHRMERCPQVLLMLGSAACSRTESIAVG